MRISDWSSDVCSSDLLTLSSTLGPIGAQSPTAAEEDGVMTDQVKLDIPLLLPEVDSDADRCVARLISDLEGREGVDKVHVVRTSDGTPPQLCIHYRPDILPLERVRPLAPSPGAQPTAPYQHPIWANH